MTEDQQLAWDMLSCNYAKLAHAWGHELSVLSKIRGKKRFHAKAEQCLQTTLSWPTEERARAVKTWLSTYQLPLDPERLHSFNRFHETTASFVVTYSRDLRAYE
jgi:hypothetical protein